MIGADQQRYAEQCSQFHPGHRDMEAGRYREGQDGGQERRACKEENQDVG